MNDINFENFLYYPKLRTRAAELKGLKHLTDNRKDQIIPLITAGKWPRATSFESGINKINEVFENRPFFLDLTDEYDTFTEEQTLLKSSSNNYQNWRNYVQRFPNALPIAQIDRHSSNLRDFVTQARLCEQEFGKVAFVINDYIRDIEHVVSALSALDDVNNAITFIDSKYIRNSYPAVLAANIQTINTIRNDIPEANISTLSTSFPSSLASFSNDANKTRGVIDILERQLHEELGGYEVASYGDYASIHGIVYDNAPDVMRWAARVDYPTEQYWQFERRPKNSVANGSTGTAKSDFIHAAQAIFESNPHIAESDIWGEQMIFNTATNPEFDGIGFGPAAWISVRVNIHLSKQIDYSNQLTSEDGQEWDEDEGLL
ncbi:beta family protein [Acinetobacter proteolyticus]|uniref:Protein beta n=1 Tax=Acinetobacter proteolyticus TaxID=1776741 RepID=A0A2N0WET7_9GAMM|nr:beta family protein [Acinetobacter proteolyticus]PKF33376.1 protein beta [Acinetobacter proteolyticus]